MRNIMRLNLVLVLMLVGWATHAQSEEKKKPNTADRVQRMVEKLTDDSKWSPEQIESISSIYSEHLQKLEELRKKIRKKWKPY